MSKELIEQLRKENRELKEQIKQLQEYRDPEEYRDPDYEVYMMEQEMIEDIKKDKTLSYEEKIQHVCEIEDCRPEDLHDDFKAEMKENSNVIADNRDENTIDIQSAIDDMYNEPDDPFTGF